MENVTSVNLSTTAYNLTGTVSLSIGGILFCIVLTPLTSFIGLATNGFTIALLLKRKLRDSTDIILFSLTVSDLICLALVLFDSFCNVLSFISYQRNPNKSFQELFLKIGYFYFNFITFSLSKPVNVLVAAQRCSAVLRPATFQSFWTKKKTTTMVLVLTVPVIVVGIIDGVSVMAVGGLTYNTLQGAYFFTPDKQKYAAVMLLFGIFLTSIFFLPIPLTVCLNIITILGILKNRTKVQDQNETRSRRNAEEIGVTKRLLLVSLLFLVLNTPFTFQVFGDRFDSFHVINDQNTEVYNLLYDFSYFLVIVNMATNCFVFVLGSPKYRKTNQHRIPE